MNKFSINIQQLGLRDYVSTWQAMQSFTHTRTADTADEIWVLEHLPVFTQGQSGKAEHLLMLSEIPVVQTDRGGQVTYHGPGQLVVYLLIDLKRRGLGLRQLVDRIEQSVIHLLQGYGIIAISKPNAPGVYVDNAKICSLGLRIRRGCSYHGLSLNVAMDLTPFTQINPCGFPGLAITQLQNLGVTDSLPQVGEKLVKILIEKVDGLSV